MVEITVRVPEDLEDLKDIIGDTSEAIYLEALHVVARRRLSQVKKRLKELKKKAASYEIMYGMSFEKFSQNVPDTVKGHDDWIEWTYLSKVIEDLSSKVEKLTILAGK